MACFYFQDAVEKYRKINRNLMKSRAELIFSKYIKPSNTADAGTESNGRNDNTVVLDSDTVSKITEGIAFEKGLQSIFDTARDKAAERLESCFPEFLKSSLFAMYIASIALPRQMMPKPNTDAHKS